MANPLGFLGNIIGGITDTVSTENTEKESLKILKSLIPGSDVYMAFEKSIGRSADFVLTMDRSFAKIAANMGVGVNQSSLIKENFARTTEEVISMGGKFEDTVKLQEDFIASTNKAVLLNSEIAKSLYATTKVTNVAADALLKGFLDAGYEADNIAENMLKTQVVANKMGVNAQAVSSMVVANLDKLNKYTFSDGVEGLAKMAGKAAMFRIDMNETFTLADKLLSPENAIEVASALQRLGGSASQLASPLRLMDLAQNNVPELQNQLGKLVEKYTYFDEKTKSFQIMPGARRELKAVGDALGVSEQTLTKLSIEGAKLKKKMSEISFDGLNFSKEQQEQIANLSNLKDGKYQIEFKDDSGKTITKTLDELKNLQGDEKKAFENYLTKQTEEVGKDPQIQMVDLAKEQLSKTDTMIASINRLQMAIPLALAGGKGGESILATAAEVQKKNFEASKEQFSFDNLSPKVDKVAKGFGDLLSAIGTGDKNGVENAITSMKTTIKNFTADVAGTEWDAISEKIEKIKNLNFTNLLSFEENEDFIWRPGEKIQKFRKDDIILGGTNLIEKKMEEPKKEVVKNIIETNTSNINKTESTVGGEITFKVVVDSSSSKNISITEANLIGERVAAAIKSRPDLQDEFKKALNFSMNEPKPR